MLKNSVASATVGEKFFEIHLSNVAEFIDFIQGAPVVAFTSLLRQILTSEADSDETGKAYAVVQLNTDNPALSLSWHGQSDLYEVKSVAQRRF